MSTVPAQACRGLGVQSITPSLLYSCLYQLGFGELPVFSTDSVSPIAYFLFSTFVSIVWQ